MGAGSGRGWHWLVGLLLAAGCCGPVRYEADLLIREMSSRPLDVAPPQLDATPPPQGAIEPAPPEPRKLSERLQIPPDLPGADAPAITLPRLDPANKKERDAAIDRLYPALPPLGANPQPLPGPEGRPLTLADLQHLALTNNPNLRQAAADVEAKRGALIQAGLYPNPIVGFQQGNSPTNATPGYQGPFVEQTIVTAGKLKLAQASAAIELQNAELALKKAQFDLATQVRAGYFAVLVAQADIQAKRALARFTDEIYRIHVEQVRAAQAAAYEPLQMRVLALQARGDLVQARNRYISAWKQLAATLGLPALPPTELAGRVDMPMPRYQYDRVLLHVLGRHTDVLTARNNVEKARYDLRRAQVAPIPDVDVQLYVQKDFTAPPFSISPTVQVGVPVPVWDRNQGNIKSAQAQLLRAVEDSHQVRINLTARLAEAFERYENNRVLLDYYRNHIVPDQVRSYRGSFERHQQEPDRVDFGEVVNSQQTLAASINTYIRTLGEMWSAVVSVADLLQTIDLFQVGGETVDSDCLPPLPEMDLLAPLPCCHPDSPLPDAVWKGADGHWPEAIPPGDPVPQSPPPTEELLPPPKKADEEPAAPQDAANRLHPSLVAGEG